MKTTRPLLLISLVVATAALAFGADKIVAGPKGGRLLDTTPQKTEFFVTDDRRVEVTFYDAALKPVDPGARTVTVTAEPSTGRAAVELERTATGFISKSQLPPGEPYRVVVQVREKADAKPQNFRVDLNLAICGECRKKEYACTCEGH